MTRTRTRTRRRRFMGVDQYGRMYHNLRYPRKDLLQRLGRKHADKIYTDGDDGPLHVGYIIACRWILMYEVAPWKGISWRDALGD